jgi:hypothetical protein
MKLFKFPVWNRVTWMPVEIVFMSNSTVVCSDADDSESCSIDFAPFRIYVAPRNRCDNDLLEIEPEELHADGPLPRVYKDHLFRQLESVYSPERDPLMLDVKFEIDDRFKTVNRTVYPPFTKVDREEDYRHALEEFSNRYAKIGG